MAEKCSIVTRNVGRILSLLLITTAVATADATTRGLKMVQVKDHHSGETIALYENSYALLIGASEYRNPAWPDLESIPGELELVEGALSSQGFVVEKHLNPNGRKLRSLFEEFINRYGYDKNNRLLFYFAGHGYTRQNGTKGYLVPVDAPSPEENSRGFLRKSLPMTQILAYARDSEAKHSLFLFDSCFSGTVFKTRSLPNKPPHITQMTAQPVRQFITAGSAGEVVPAKSTFTMAFVDALEYGVGDLNHDGYISGTELGLHLQAEVPRHVSQTPQFGKIQDYELSRGDFVFVLPESSVGSPDNLVKPLDQGGEFDIASLLALAKDEQEREEQAKRKWTQQLLAMKEAYRQVEELEGMEVSAALKIRGWRTFMAESAHQQNNPYSQEDDQLRSSAEQRLRYWRGKQREQKSLQQPQPGAISEQTTIPAAPKNFKMVTLGRPGEELCYAMGSPQSEKGRSADERRHRVCIKGFKIASHEVTNAMYRNYRADHHSVEYQGHDQNDPSQPVVWVSWNEANDYIAWLNQTLRPAQPYRLPTEAEWEYAARGGTTTSRYWGEDRGEGEACDYANVSNPSSKREFDWSWDSFRCEDGHKVAAAVGQFTPNGYGLYDMLGNVWEWTSSEYEGKYGGEKLRGSTQGRNSGQRVLRGGSWGDAPWSLRAALRLIKAPGYRGSDLGFRIAQDL